MKLYERNMTECTVLLRTYADDGEGGQRMETSFGQQFSAAIIPEKMREAEIGGKDRTVGKYSVYIPLKCGVRLVHGDRFRSADGRIFSVTGEDQAPPEFSVIRFCRILAESECGEDGI